MPAKRLSYTHQFKLEIVKSAVETSIHAAANKFKIDQKQVRNWMNNEGAIQRIDNNKGPVSYFAISFFGFLGSASKFRVNCRHYEKEVTVGSG